MNTSTTALATALLASLAGPAFADGDDHIRLPKNLPAALQIGPPEELHFYATGVGDQIYDCKASGNGFAWVFRAPEAILLRGDGDADDKQIGIHYAGPTWANDRGTVKGAVAARVAAPDPVHDIPWLRLDAVETTGKGRFSQVTSILRLDTVGGVAPAVGCDANHVGDVARVPYRATYFFFHLEDEDDGDDDGRDHR